MMAIMATTTPTAAKVPATAPLFEKNEESSFVAAAEALTVLEGEVPPTFVVITIVEVDPSELVENNVD
jgi:hypothetical protein